MKKVVLAFSGGLDTSYCAIYLSKEMGLEVHAALANTGGFSAEELASIEKRAYDLGVKSYVALDVTQDYYQHAIKYMIFGNVLKNGTYPISVSSERISQATAIAKYAEQIGADYLCHGSTGAGNDQVRFDMVFNICWGMPYDPQSSLAAMRAPVYGDYAAQQGLEDKAEIDQAITDILTSTDETERQELYDFVLTRLHEDAVYIPLTYETNKALYTSELKGVHFGTDQYDVDFASMYFE